MQQSTTQEPDPVEWGPLVFELRQLRLYARDAGLSQAELASIAGISPRLLRSYETCRALPASVKALLCLAVALKVPFEWLIEPRLLESMRAAIDARRPLPSKRPPVGTTTP
jgi:transcriptional regulator with XRE-family HTH domain